MPRSWSNSRSSRTMPRSRPISAATSPIETLKRCIRKGTIRHAFVPVLCGSAFKNKGVQPLLDAVVEYLPSPIDVPGGQGHQRRNGRRSSARRPMRSRSPALAFKIMTDPFVGSITFVRVYSGTCRSGMTCSTRSRTSASASAACCRCTPIIAKTSRKRAPATSSLWPVSSSRPRARRCAIRTTPVILERMEFPDPVIEIAVEPKTKADQEKMGMALVRLAQEDPSFRVTTDAESGQTILKGMGELHLEIKVDILKRTYKIDANVGAPQVAYRETITRAADVDYTHKKQTGGSGQFARVKMHFEPLPAGSGFSFASKVVGGTVPKEYIPGVEKGVKGSLDNGVLAGFPVIDFKVELTDGAYHEVDSSALAFEIAARAAMKEGLAKAWAEAA